MTASIIGMIDLLVSAPGFFAEGCSGHLPRKVYEARRGFGSGWIAI
jgi:hypothetical protein